MSALKDLVIYIFTGAILIGGSLWVFLLFFGEMFGITSEKSALIITGIITIIVSVICWTKRNEPIDKNVQYVMRSETGNNKDGIDDGGE